MSIKAVPSGAAARIGSEQRQAYIGKTMQQDPQGMLRALIAADTCA